MRRLGRALVLVSVAVIGAACSASTPSASNSSTSSATTTSSATNTTTTTSPPIALGTELLSVSALPTGWAVDNSSSSGGLGCLSHVLEAPATKQTASAEVTFAQNGNLPQLEEKLATYASSASAAFAKVVAVLNGCKQISGTESGSKATGTIGQMSFPHYGDQSAAFDVNLTIGGVSAGEDFLVVRKGVVVMGIAEGDLGTPNITQFEHFVALALAKVS